MPYVYECVCEREDALCMCVCVRERRCLKREKMPYVYVCVCEREMPDVCVCVWERERCLRSLHVFSAGHVCMFLCSCVRVFVFTIPMLMIFDCDKRTHADDRL